MLVRELPDDDKRELRELADAANEPWDVLEGLTLEELQQWFKARQEDAEAKMERMRRHIAIETELNELARKAAQTAGDVEMWKLKYFLHGAERQRFQELMRELDEISKVPLVTRDRQPWHRAVEEEIHRGLHRRGGCSTEEIVSAVLARDSSFQRGPVERYALYILETSSGMR